MKDNLGQVIYVGKATSLRDRLSQYFNKPDRYKTKLLVSHISSIDFVITKDPIEALILESNLIKNYQPKYNMILKDAKHYAYLAVTNEEFPRLIVARKNSKNQFRVKAAKFYGPFVEGSKRSISARYLRKLFKIRICTKLPKKECLQYHLGNCDAPCINGISKENYGKNVDALDSVLEGKEKAHEIIKTLEERMKTDSKLLEYEKAATIRDQIESLKIFFQRQSVEKIRNNDEDYVWFSRIGVKLHAQMLRSRNGVISKSEKYSNDINDQEEPEKAFCIQYYTKDNLPDRIYSNLSEIDMQELNQALGNIFIKAGREKMKVLEIAAKSLVQGEVDQAVLKIKDELKLENNPVVIETFDNSNLFGENAVASMVQFVNGLPNKSEYRRFGIKTVEGIDDFSSMKEVVFRRYSRLLKEGGTLPDLILIDGGAGQLHAAIDGLEQAGVKIAICSIAKREEEIYLPNRMETIKMERSNKALKLLQQCRDEAHRFAITYHRLLRKKKMTK